jgi:hypothetical protein
MECDNTHLNHNSLMSHNKKKVVIKGVIIKEGRGFTTVCK